MIFILHHLKVLNDTRTFLHEIIKQFCFLIKFIDNTFFFICIFIDDMLMFLYDTFMRNETVARSNIKETFNIHPKGVIENVNIVL